MSPFDWMVAPKTDRKRATERRAEVIKEELEAQASLLYRLGYPSKRCKARLKANVAEEYELHGRAPAASEIDRVVDAVYRRGGVGALTV